MLRALSANGTIKDPLALTKVKKVLEILGSNTETAGTKQDLTGTMPKVQDELPVSIKHGEVSAIVKEGLVPLRTTSKVL